MLPISNFKGPFPGEAMDQSLFADEYFNFEDLLGIKVEETLEDFVQDFFGEEEEGLFTDFHLKSTHTDSSYNDKLHKDGMWCADSAPESNPHSIHYDPPTDLLWSSDMVLVNPDEMIKSENEPEPYNPALDHNYIKVAPDPLQMPIKVEIKQELDGSDLSDYVSDDNSAGVSPVNSSCVSYLNSVNASYANSSYATDDEYHVSDENTIDVWNPVFPSAPALLTARRQCGRKGKAPQVSIKQAANAALKRPQTNSNYDMRMRKRRKMASVETTPSGSDCEESVKPRMSAKSQVAVKPRAQRGRKGQGKRGPARKNAPAKPTKSDVQRTNHNLNEKMRRNHMSTMMDDVRNLVPIEFYRDRTEKARAKASKQKVLVAAKAYVLHLGQMEENPGMYMQYDHRDAKRKIALKSKLKKLVKQFGDKFQRTYGYVYQTTAGIVL